MTVEELEVAIRVLPVDDRKKLYQRLGGVEQRKDNLIEVRIDDWQDQDSLRPRATMVYSDGSEVTIDILASVESHATSIGHPAILHAIRRWEQICLLRHAQARSNVYQPIKPDFGVLAQQHLEQLGQSMLRGAKKRALPKEEALDIYIHKLGLDTDYYYLHLAWQLLETEEVKKLRRADLKLNLIEKKLRNYAALLCQVGGSTTRGQLRIRAQREHRFAGIVNAISHGVNSDSQGS